MEKKATTLMELIIALAISAGLAAVTLVAFSQLDKRALESSARSIYVDLAWAKEAATLHQHKYLFVIDTADKSYTIGEDKNDDDALSDQEREIYKRLNTSVSVTPAATIRFSRPFGKSVDASGATSADTVITLTRAGNTKQVNIISETGFLEIQ
ncbi:MAG: hypothetical protein WDL87_09485 [Candidatus Omnitrophota bacterium]|jgi:Tfp pilus assembly protein FimT